MSLAYYHNSLDMCGLGEHAEGVHALQAVPKFNEILQVACEGARVAGDVDHFVSQAGLEFPSPPH